MDAAWITPDDRTINLGYVEVVRPVFSAITPATHQELLVFAKKAGFKKPELSVYPRGVYKIPDDVRQALGSGWVRVALDFAWKPGQADMVSLVTNFSSGDQYYSVVRPIPGRYLTDVLYVPHVQKDPLQHVYSDPHLGTRRPDVHVSGHRRTFK